MGFFVVLFLLLIIISLDSAGLGWKSWKRRWFVLTETSLVFYKSDPVSFCIVLFISRVSQLQISFLIEVNTLMCTLTILMLLIIKYFLFLML